MGFKDMRAWIDRLEAEGELKRITAQVDWDLEIAEVARRGLAQRGPAILFKISKITGTPAAQSCSSMVLPDEAAWR